MDNRLKDVALAAAATTWISLGVALIIDHLFRFGYLDRSDIWGHDWLGLALILIGICTLAYKCHRSNRVARTG